MFQEIDALLAQWGPVWAGLIAIGIWWAGTSLVLLIDGLPRDRHPRSLWIGGAATFAAFAGLAMTRSQATPAAAYVAFLCAIVVWGWNELSFLTGRITGPRRSACPDDCSGLRHVGHAIATVIHHELAVAVCGIAIFALTWGAANPVAAWTYGVLWVMRISAKLNLFLGVPNLSEELLPPHLEYLERYFTRRSMNALFPFSITAGTIATVWLAQHALAADAAPFEGVGYGLVATLMGLAVLEHWFFVLPIPTTALWKLGLRSHETPDAARGLRSHPGPESQPLRTAPAQPARPSKPERSLES
jgi:putative photosynthetic complex assembly protein 2